MRIEFLFNPQPPPLPEKLGKEKENGRKEQIFPKLEVFGENIFYAFLAFLIS